MGNDGDKWGLMGAPYNYPSLPKNKPRAPRTILFTFHFSLYPSPYNYPKKKRSTEAERLCIIGFGDYFTEAFAMLLVTNVDRFSAVTATPPIVQFSKVI